MSSNNLTQVRDYLKTRMTAVEPTFTEWTGSLEEVSNIPQTKLDTSYHITLGVDSSSTQADRHIVDEFNVVISVFKRGYNSPTDARDTLLQTANCIRLDVINPRNIEDYKFANDGNIENVVSQSLTPSEIEESNDNIIKVEIELNVRLYFGIL